MQIDLKMDSKYGQQKSCKKIIGYTGTCNISLLKVIDCSDHDKLAHLLHIFWLVFFIHTTVKMED